uniref:Uncharacterized protein n=1 Tax=Lepeophtheirus salmonis TaxID=72036 RepID=A0A0K2UGU2_LEPSM
MITFFVPHCIFHYTFLSIILTFNNISIRWFDTRGNNYSYVMGEYNMHCRHTIDKR